MNKKIISIVIVSMFLLIGIVSASADNSIILSNVSIEKSKEITSPCPLAKFYHIKGSGEGIAIAFQFGSILIIRAFPRISGFIQFEYYPLDDPNDISNYNLIGLMTMTFSGELIKPGDGTFQFEGDVFSYWCK